MATNLQWFISSYGSRRFIACGWLLNVDILAGNAARQQCCSESWFLESDLARL